MKKTTILLLILSTFSYFAKAQSSVEGGIIVMPQYTALLNTNDFAAGNDLNYSTTFGFAGGLSGAYNFNNHVGIELNLIFSSQGEKYTGNLSDYKPKADTASYANLVSFQAQLAGISPTAASVNPYNAQISLTYFKIPVLFKLTSNTEKTTFFYMNVGPQFNILLSASESLNGNTVTYTSTNPLSAFSFSTKQLFESSGVDVVLNLGTGFNLSSNLVLTAQINFDYGLTDAEDKSFEFPISIYTPAFSSTPTTEEVHAYTSNRSSNNNATVGLRIGLAYKFGSSK